MRLLIPSLDCPCAISSHRPLFFLVQDGICGTGSCWGKDRNGMLSHQQWGWDKSLQAESFPE